MSQVTIETQVASIETQVELIESQADETELAEYVPAFAAKSIGTPVNQRELDSMFAKRLTICEFSLDISGKGNIVGILRVPPVQAADRFYAVLRARFNNAGIRNHQSAVDAHNGWGQITLSLGYNGSYPDALWLSETCRDRSFPKIAGYQELQARVHAKHQFLMDVLASGQINFVMADYRTVPQDFWPEGITEESVSASPATRNTVIKKTVIKKVRDNMQDEVALSSSSSVASTAGIVSSVELKELVTDTVAEIQGQVATRATRGRRHAG